MNKNVIIVAGGKGLRMGQELPKQFIAIKEKPILMHTLESFYNADAKTNIIVVLPQSFIDYWSNICKKYNFDIPHTIAIGGETRFHSVKNGLSYVKDGFVAVHDGARPFASSTLINKLFNEAILHKAVIPVTDVTDSLREMTDENNSKIIDRSKIKQVQTPQVFNYEVLEKAYQLKYSEIFTDDASVVEKYGVNIHLVQGETSNIKITTPFDLEIANIILDLKFKKEDV